MKSAENFELDLRRIGIKTDDSWRHDCERTSGSEGRTKYSFPDLKATIVAVLKDNTLISISSKEKIPDDLKPIENVEVVVEGSSFGLIFDRTNFTCETEDSRFDKGSVIINDQFISVYLLRRYNDFIVHQVTLRKDQRLIIFVKI